MNDGGDCRTAPTTQGLLKHPLFRPVLNPHLYRPYNPPMDSLLQPHTLHSTVTPSVAPFITLLNTFLYLFLYPFCTPSKMWRTPFVPLTFFKSLDKHSRFAVLLVQQSSFVVLLGSILQINTG